ncbi:hypothetical protein PVAND_008171 [Polypedilum vanderplanki]|uniref:Transcription factor IIIC 90kDa subunit N-terminal domain-containing protein n=1 Tax=Polypedilum vanderplanki TaxID=319348 RepID=A0A9J6C9E2_POLVA|nr:hypothetical protein PVAND_008171 [Polypedilum vanderplanki]
MSIEQNNMDFKLKHLSSLITYDKISYPFSLQSIQDIIIQCNKSACEVISISNQSDNNIQSNLYFTSTKTTKPIAIPQLNINAEKIFNNCNHDEKNFIMLNPYFLPECTAKNTHYLKCRIGLYTEQSDIIIACLTSSGIIELFSFILDKCELKQFNSNLNEKRKENLKNLPKEIIKFDMYKNFLYDISFSNFEWCPKMYENFKILLGITKNDEIIFYRVQNDVIFIQDKSFEIEDIGKNRAVKWMNMNDEHFLLVSTNNGNLIRFSIILRNDGIIEDIEKIDEIAGKLKLPISNIIIDYLKSSTAIVLCTKVHSLEIFQFNENDSKLVLSKYIGLTITGVEVCINLQYFISILNGKVYFLKLNISRTNEVELETWTQIEHVSNVDDVQASTNYAYYGITKSRNNVLIFLSCYPQIAFDHLTNKQPAQISVNLFTKYDPFQILMDNQSLKLTDYSDCVVAVRFIGASKLETLGVLENMNYRIQLSDEFIYYLKLQLLVINIKYSFYKMRSNSISEMITRTKESILEILSVMHFFKLLQYLLSVKDLSQKQFVVIRSSSIAIKNYCNTKFEMETFKSAAETLRTQFQALLKICDTKVEKANLPPEVCHCCDENIAPNSLICSQNHKLKRCIVTNLILQIDSNSFCRQCRENVVQLETFSTIFGNSFENSRFYLCPFCDSKLAFYD